MRNEKKAWLILVGFLLLIGLSTCIFNVFIDCANQLRSLRMEEEIAEAIIAGTPVYFPTHPNESRCKEELIKVLPEHFDTVAIGASLQMTLNQNMLGLQNGEFYNLGISGMNLNDYLNTLGMMKIFGKDANNFIFLLHIDVFLPNTDTRNQFQQQYGKDYLAYLNGENKYNYADPVNLIILFRKIKDTISTALSISYFRENLLFFISHGQAEQRFIVGGNHPEYAHYMPDGSWVYALEFQQRTIADVMEDSDKNGKTYMHVGKHANPKNFDLFDKIVSDLLKQGKKIVLYYPPYCPSLYALYSPQNSPCFQEIEDFISRYKYTENVTILGSFYPEDLGIKDENYYDARHIRREDLPLAFRYIER